MKKFFNSQGYLPVIFHRFFIKSIVLTFALFLFLGANMDASTNYIKETRMSMKMENAFIKDVLFEIEKLSNFYFVYNNQLIDVNKRVDIDVDAESVDKILNELFDPSTVDYTFLDNQVVLSPKGMMQTEQQEQQKKVVKGSVVDSGGEPIPGVNVFVKGTTSGTITDFEGNYTLDDVSPQSTLVFSFIGMKTQDVEVGDQFVIDVTLMEESLGLDEVVVVGYGSMKKSDLTGAISTVSSEDMQKMATQDVGEALQGRAAGVMVSKSSGKPGAGSEIKIRGVNSINQTDPLWVVDGVKGAPVGSMDDVESISILKDAAAAAIYGKDAANGVILVTTKRGSKDKTSFNFHGYNSWNILPDFPQPLNSQQLSEAKIASLRAGGVDEETIEDQYGYYLQDFDVSTDWADEMTRMGNLQNYSLSASGGTEKANYFLSGNIQDQKGNVINNDYSSYNFKVNSDISITDWLKLGESINYQHSEENPLARGEGDKLFKQIYRAIPMIPVYDETNTVGGGYGFAPPEAQWNGPNPVAVQNLYDGNRIDDRLFINVHSEITPIEGLKWRTDLSGKFQWQKDDDLELPFFHSNGNQETRNFYRYQLEESSNHSLSSYLSYNESFGSHNITLMQGFEAEKSSSSWVRSEAYELKSVDVLNTTLTNDPLTLASDMNRGHGAEYGYFGRLSYDFDQKYLIQANYRYDYSAKFGPDYSGGLFPSFSLGWRVSEESFLRDVSWLSDLKLRGGWGILGIDNINPYQFSQEYLARGYQDFGGSLVQGLHLRRIPNYAIRWEEIKQLNLGLDFALFSNKLNGSVDYYDKTTTDMLINVEIPNQASFGNYLGNRGEVSNKGFDIVVNYQTIINNDLRIRVSGTANFNKNEVLDLLGTEDSPNILTSSSEEFTTSRTEVGHPLASFYGYIADGIIQSPEQLDALNEGAPGSYYQKAGTRPGDILFKDIASRDEEGNIVMIPDGAITEADQTFLGSPWPKWNYGLNFSMDYKGVDFNMFWTGVTGNEIFNETKVWTDQLYGDANSSTNILDSWSESNPNGSVPRLTSNDQNENFKKPSTYFIEDGSFLRLKNLQIGYTLPNELTRKALINSMRVYVSGMNLLTFTAYDGIDPEFVTEGGNNRKQGVDQITTYPQFKSYTFGVQVEF